MNDLIQVMKILDQDEVQELNSYVDNLQFQKSTVFSSDKTQDPKSNSRLRSSTGCTLQEDHELIKNFHLK